MILGSPVRPHVAAVPRDGVNANLDGGVVVIVERKSLFYKARRFTSPTLYKPGTLYKPDAPSDGKRRGELAPRVRLVLSR